MQEAQDVALIFHIRLSRSLCLPSSLATQFYILLHQLLIDENQRQICTTAFSFMFVPFAPILHPSSLPSASPKDGKNFNDGSEDSRDLIGNCDCHSKDVGLFGRRKGERSGIEGQEEKEKNPGFVQTKEMSWLLHLIVMQARLQKKAFFRTVTAHTGGVQPIDSVLSLR